LFADRFPLFLFVLSFFFTSHGLYIAPPMDLQEYIFTVINLIYRGCIRRIAMKGFAYEHECCKSVLPKNPGPYRLSESIQS